MILSVYEYVFDVQHFYTLSLQLDKEDEDSDDEEDEDPDFYQLAHMPI